MRACVIKEVQHSMKWNFGGEGQVTVLENISYVNVGRAITRLKSLCTLTIFEKAFSIIVIHVQSTSKCKNIGTVEDDCSASHFSHYIFDKKIWNLGMILPILLFRKSLKV